MTCVITELRGQIEVFQVMQLAVQIDRLSYYSNRVHTTAQSHLQ